MNAVVLLRAVIDSEAPSDTPAVKLDAPSTAALCQALEWRRSGGGHLTGLAVGPATWEAVLREALALGLDAAVRVPTQDGGPRDVAWTAAVLATAMPPGTVAVFAGSAASDSGSGTLPAALAGILDWPLVADVVSAVQVEEQTQAEVIASPGVRRTYRVEGPAVLVGAAVPPPPVYAPLARRLVAARTAIGLCEPDEVSAPPAERSVFVGYGPGKPRTKHLLKPSAAARPGDRLSQLMAGGPQRSSSKLSGDAADLARQLADLLAQAGLLPD